MVTTRTNLTSLLLFVSTGSVYTIKFLLLQTIIIEVSLYCDKAANVGPNTHKADVHLLSFGYCFCLVWI